MNRIRELRTEKGIRQIDLAKYLNIAQNTLSYWEKGKYDIDNNSLQKLAIYFETTTDYILGLTNSSSLSDSQKNITVLDEEAFSNRLQFQRTEKGLSQNALAEKIGLSRSLYNKYEKAGIRPPYKTLILLANELNTTVDYLIGNTNIQPSYNQKQEPPVITANEALQILAKEKDLSKKDIEYLKETIKLLEMKNKTKTLNDEFGKKSL